MYKMERNKMIQTKASDGLNNVLRVTITIQFEAGIKNKHIGEQEQLSNVMKNTILWPVNSTSKPNGQLKVLKYENKYCLLSLL